jgi:cyclopropane-fatty-acyl-phospholipid synthase
VGEAYMDGDLVVERGSLYDLVAIGTRNMRATRKRLLPWGSGRLRNPPWQARRNAAHHYDLSGEFFRLFLDDDLQYSCAYFPYDGMGLDAGQRAKKRHLAAKLLTEPGQRILDIGSGWGGLALTLAEEHGAEVLGVTLSTEQLEVARQRASQRRLSERVKFELRDFREVEGRFDRIVSVGMFEHVGPAHYDEFFETLARLLDEKGVAVLHTIGRVNGPGAGNAWIEKYIFPGGTIPALSEIAPSVEKSGLMLTDVEVLRLHYAETLKAWSARFAERRDEARRLYDERFCRMWEFYLAGAEAGFRVGDLVVFQLQMAKDRTVVPMTRDYITDFDRGNTEGARFAAE